MSPSGNVPARPRDAHAMQQESPHQAPTPPAVRHHHRERDFGIGYGNSSGYGCEAHYARTWVPDRFRCV